MKCKCGYQNSEGAVFCAGCGRKLNGKKTTKLQWFLLIVLAFLVIALCVVIAKEPNNATSLEATAPAHTPNATSENIHIHSWQEATCEKPQTCTTCKEKQGDALGHSWEAATCTMPQVCKVCGKTVGEALNHQWIDATYDAPKTCENCGATEGTALEKTAALSVPAQGMIAAGNYHSVYLCPDGTVFAVGSKKLKHVM